MKKRVKLLAWTLALSLLCACTAESPAPTETPNTPAPVETPAATPFVFTRENFPTLDGSTATVPLAQAVASVLLGESREEIKDLISFSKTTESYYNLIAGGADLLVVAEASPDVADWAKEQNVALVSQPVAAEALVFLVNEDNPVDSLTAQQVRDIYSGKITNWSEVGGEDRPITAFQRNENSGSQIIMEKEVMGDTPMAQAPTGYVVSEMGALMEAVRGYDGSPGAIGYSVYYYANDMNMADGLKLLKIDGVTPEAKTIRAEEYPLRTYYYAVRRADAAADSPAAILFDWLLGEEGQKLVNHEGYVSVLDVENAS